MADDPIVPALVSVEAKIETMGKMLGLRLDTIKEQVASDGRTTAQRIQFVGEQLDRLTDEVKTTYVRMDVYALAHREVVEDIATLRDNLRFVSRTAWTAVLLPAVVLFFGYLFLSGGPPS